MSPHAQLYTAPFCADCGRPIGGLAELDALARNGGLRRPVRAESAAARP